MSQEVSIVIDRPAEVIFPYLTETDKLKQWMNTFIGSTRPTDGQLSTGMTFVDTYGQSGGASDGKVEVLAYEPNRHLQLSMVSAFATATMTFTLAPAGGGTQVVYTVDSQMTNPILKALMKLTGFLMNSAVRGQYQNDLKKLKKLVEQA